MRECVRARVWELVHTYLRGQESNIFIPSRRTSPRQGERCPLAEFYHRVRQLGEQTYLAGCSSGDTPESAGGVYLSGLSGTSARKSRGDAHAFVRLNCCIRTRTCVLMLIKKHSQNIQSITDNDSYLMSGNRKFAREMGEDCRQWRSYCELRLYELLNKTKLSPVSKALFISTPDTSESCLPITRYDN